MGGKLARGRTLARIALLLGAVLVVGAVVVYWVWPTQEYYRRTIMEADRVELAVSLSPGMVGAIDVAVVADAEGKKLLAESIELVGSWSPLERAIGNTWRIRAIRGGKARDIIVRGFNRIKHWDWTIGTTDSLRNAFSTLVDRHGRWPTWEESTGEYEKARLLEDTRAKKQP